MIKQLASNEIREYLKTQPNCVLLDVRTNNEWEQVGKPDGEIIGLKTYFLSLQFGEERIFNKNFVQEIDQIFNKNTKGNCRLKFTINSENNGEAFSLELLAREKNIEYDTFESIRHFKTGLNWEKNLSSNLSLSSYVFFSKRDFEGKLPFEYGGIVNLKRDYYGMGANFEYRLKPSHLMQFRMSVSDQNDKRKRYENFLGFKGSKTLSQKELFYSYRRSSFNKEEDYGRCISVILMT